MARLYAYKCIQAEERKLQEQFENLPINGRKTTRQTIKRIKELKLDASYRLAQKCNVMVSWHKNEHTGTACSSGRGFNHSPGLHNRRL